MKIKITKNMYSLCARSEPWTAFVDAQADTRWQCDSSQLATAPPSSSQPSPVLSVEAATSVFNGMSRNGRIVPACLKYRVSLNNPPPPPPSFRKLQRSCCSEDVLSSLFSNSNKLSPCLLFSAALFARH